MVFGKLFLHKRKNFNAKICACNFKHEHMKDKNIFFQMGKLTHEAYFCIVHHSPINLSYDLETSFHFINRP